jgi:hypothetical protein
VPRAKSKKQKAKGEELRAKSPMPYALCLMLLCLSFLYIWCTTSPAQDSVEATRRVAPTSSLFEKTEIIEGKDFKEPHQLAYWPIISGTDKVWIDGVMKSRDVDYIIDYKIGRLSVKEEVAQESVISVSSSCLQRHRHLNGRNLYPAKYQRSRHRKNCPPH